MAGPSATRYWGFGIVRAPRRGPEAGSGFATYTTPEPGRGEDRLWRSASLRVRCVRISSQEAAEGIDVDGVGVVGGSDEGAGGDGAEAEL